MLTRIKNRMRIIHVYSVVTIVVIVFGCNSNFVDFYEAKKIERIQRESDRPLAKDQEYLDSLYRSVSGKGYWETTNKAVINEFNTRIDRLKRVFKLFNLNIYGEKKFLVLEEEDTKFKSPDRDCNIYGTLIINDSRYDYIINPNIDSVFISQELLNINDDHANIRTRMRYTQLLTECKYDELINHAISVDPSRIDEYRYQYYLLLFNSCSKKGVEEMYLHEILKE